MGIFDVLLGRTKPAKADLDRLFRLPGAAMNLQAALGLRPSGHAGVCFKPMAGRSFSEARSEIAQLLQLPDDGNDAPVGLPTATAGPTGSSTSRTRLPDREDKYGYTWVQVESGDFEELVTRVHVVNSTLEGNGYGPMLLCSVFSFVAGPLGADSDGPGQVSTEELAALGIGNPGVAGAPTGRDVVGGGWSSASPAYLVYLYKRGTFYPFVPTGHEKRDLDAEMVLATATEHDLAIEKEKERWFPIWDVPVR